MSTLPYIILTLLVGLCVPVMSSLNASLGRTFGSPFTATLGVFLVALTMISLIIATTRTGLPTLPTVLGAKWWYWLGGVIVVMNIVTFTLVPQKIGVGNMVVIFVAGQLLSSLVIDHFGLLNIQPHPINWPRVAGALLLITGVILIKRF